MSASVKWCEDKTRLSIWDKQVFCFNKYGAKFWLLNGERHRKNGPACEYVDGTKYWYLNGAYHRENGPAVEWCNGVKAWYLKGIKYFSESDYRKELNK